MMMWVHHVYLLLHTHAVAELSPEPVQGHRSSSDPAAAPAVRAAAQLLQRVLPGASEQFELELAPAREGNTSWMGIGSKRGKVHLLGTGGVELASALNWYMNDYLNATYDWNTYAEGQLAPRVLSATTNGGFVLPLPLPARQRVKERTVPASYYLNVCTHGYSLAFASWKYWSRHIDWMAMNGVTIPLAFVGQEFVWVRLFESFGLSLDDQREFYSGPAFLPWQRMGNLRGFAGPLTRDWINKRKELSLKMLARMRGLGMAPALPGFSGHVPTKFTKLFPDANFSRSPDWSGFSGSDQATASYADVMLLDTTDPLFVQLGAKFIAIQASIYGTDHLYQTDTFNEMQPPSNSPQYLRRSSHNTYMAMAMADPDAVWLMQAWLFTDGDFWRPLQIKAYLSGVPQNKLWLLDLSGDSRPFWSQTESFDGHPFVLCTLLNFGGQQGLNGNVNRMRLGVRAARSGSSIVGVGVTAEGIWQNYPLYESTLQQAWEELLTNSTEPRSSNKVDACDFGLPIHGSFLAGYPDSLGCDPWLGEKGASTGGYGCAGRWPYNRSSLASAQAWCCAHTDCAGVTLQYGLFEVRSGHTPFKGGGGDPTSYLRIDRSAGNIDQNSWFVRYGTRRYGQRHPAAVDAWQRLGASIYAGIGGGFGSPISSIPRLDTSSSSALVDGEREPMGSIDSERRSGGSCVAARAAATNLLESYALYNAAARDAIRVLKGNDDEKTEMDINGNACGCCQVCACSCAWDAANNAVSEAWGRLLAASDTLGSVATYRFDLVDIGRYVIGAKFLTVWNEYVAAFQQHNVSACDRLQHLCLEIIDDYDRLLSTDANFQLGRWLNWSHSWSR